MNDKELKITISEAESIAYRFATGYTIEQLADDFETSEKNIEDTLRILLRMKGVGK